MNIFKKNKKQIPASAPEFDWQPIIHGSMSLIAELDRLRKQHELKKSEYELKKKVIIPDNQIKPQNNMIDFSKLSQPYLIAEIGINHNRDMQIVKKLIDAAFATSWDCVKFQKRNPDVSVPEAQKYIMRQTPWSAGCTYLEYKRMMEFGTDQYDYIERYCTEKPIHWSASVWDIDSLNFMMLRYGNVMPFIKIPSAQNNNTALLLECCNTRLPLLVSTGMSSMDETDILVNLLTKYAGQFVLMHTNSSYPASEKELNLSLIPIIKQKYGCIVGYSGHEYGLESTTIAVALGAKVIERHITLDHRMWGTDQSSSVQIDGMDKLSKQVHLVAGYMGDGVKRIYGSEIAVRNKLRG